MDQLVLYVGEKNVSSWSMRGFLALAHKGLDFEERPIRLIEERDHELLQSVSPTGMVPVLHHGSRVIPDSLAIVEYLEEHFPAPGYPALWPSDPDARSHARWLSATMHSGFPRLRQELSFNLCFLASKPEPAADGLEEAAQILALWEAALSRKQDTRPFLFGAFCAADVMFAPVVWRITAFRVPAAATPRAAAYMRSVLDYPIVRRWMDVARALPPVERE